MHYTQWEGVAPTAAFVSGKSRRQGSSKLAEVSTSQQSDKKDERMKGREEGRKEVEEHE